MKKKFKVLLIKIILSIMIILVIGDNVIFNSTSSPFTVFNYQTAYAKLSENSIYGYNTFAPYLVSLTYDDGPDIYTYDIANYLKSQKISATFFVVGEYQSPLDRSGYETIPILKKVADMGHIIANHTYNHLSLLDDNVDVNYQIEQNQKEIDPYIYDECYLFRPTGGGWNKNLYDKVMQNPYLNKLQGPIKWDYNNGDWTEDKQKIAINTSANDYLNYFTQNPSNQGIILLHDRNSGDLGGPYPLELTKDIVAGLKSRGYVFVPPILKFSNPSLRSYLNSDGVYDFSDSQGWGNDSTYYETISLADINGDGLPDICARGSQGIECAIAKKIPSTGLGSSPTIQYQHKQLLITNNLDDSTGWKKDEYGSTIQFADVNGDKRADLIARGKQGIYVALAKTDTVGFGPLQLWSYIDQSGNADFSDANGWANSKTYYGTISVADVNGDGMADICARSANGIVCALSNGKSFNQSKIWLDSNFKDSQGWNNEKYTDSIKFADVDGDGRADVVARGASGIYVALAYHDREGFQNATLWSWINSNKVRDFSDEDGNWSQDSSYYSSIRVGDINGDGKADICARSPNGIVCAFSNGWMFTKYTLWTDNNMSDALGWKTNKYSETIRLADINGDGKADIIGRGVQGIVAGLAP